MIAPETIEAIKRAVNLPTLIRQSAASAKLRARGGHHIGTCPLCTRPKTQALTVYSHHWKCFRCDAGGSAIDWLMRYEGLRFGEAMQVLSDHTGIALDGGKVQRLTGVQRAAAIENTEYAIWWFERQSENIRAALDEAVSEAEAPALEITWPDGERRISACGPVPDTYTWADTLGRLLRRVEHLTIAEKRTLCNFSQRKEWKADRDEQRRVEAAGTDTVMDYARSILSRGRMRATLGGYKDPMDFILKYGPESYMAALNSANEIPALTGFVGGRS